MTTRNRDAALREERLRSAEHSLFGRAMSLYAASFPAHEQRMEASQRRIMAHAQYHFSALFDGDAFAGLALYWDAGAFLYVEHLCIAPPMRGRGLGAGRWRCSPRRVSPSFWRSIQRWATSPAAVRRFMCAMDFLSTRMRTSIRRIARGTAATRWCSCPIPAR